MLYKFKVEIRHSVKDKKTGKPQWHFVLIGRNGEVVCTGENRKSKSGIKKTIANLFPGVVTIDITKK
jgi:uncharacterized protein YegP (UPF0339 family)